MDSEREPADSPPPRRPFQFSLASLLLLMVLCSVLSAALAGMLRGRDPGTSLPPGFYVIMAAIAPMALMILLSLIRRS